MVVFFWGIYLGTLTNKIRYSGRKDLVILFWIIIGIYFHKALMLRGILTEYQFIQQILLIPFCFYCMKISRSGWVTRFLMIHPILSPPIYFLGNMTLEIYIVHVTLTTTFLSFEFPFPGNAFAFLFVTFIFSYLIKQSTDRWFVKKLISGKFRL